MTTGHWPAWLKGKYEMLKKRIIFLLFFIFSINLFADEFPKPFSKNMKEGDKIILKGSFSRWNGQPPNIRFIICDNQIIGIGKEENYPNKTIEYILETQEKSNVLFETEVALEYIGEIFISYYEQPLMYFNVVEVKILKKW